VAVLATGREIIDIAVSIEKNGAAFYDQLSRGIKKGKTATMYSALADREREHMKTFQSMLGPAHDYVNPDSYAEEYDLYLKNLVNSAVFKNESSAREAARKAVSESEALDIGIQAEKDSILFYSAIQGLVRRTDADLVGAIINEERSHLARLSELKTRLGRSPRASRAKRSDQ